MYSFPRLHLSLALSTQSHITKIALNRLLEILDTSTHCREVLSGCLVGLQGTAFHTDGVYTRHSDTRGDVGIYFSLEKMMGE